MLHHFGKVFMEVGNPITIEGHQGLYVSLKVDGRNAGQIRYNYDSTYSEHDKSLRVSYDVSDINMIVPIVSDNRQLLEDIIVGSMIWPIKDNNHIWKNSPGEPLKVYMIVHGYQEDNVKMAEINAATINILRNLGAKESTKYKDKWSLTEADMNSKLIAEVIKRSYR